MAVPVVSVGNITLGGTGKTPMVEWIARWYRRRGVRVTLISRGYGHAGGINDEGLVLEENLPDVPHLQDPDRVKLASIATIELEAELIILTTGSSIAGWHAISTWSCSMLSTPSGSENSSRVGS